MAMTKSMVMKSIHRTKHIIKRLPLGDDEERGAGRHASLERRREMKKVFAYFGALFSGVIAAGTAMAAAEGAAATGGDSGRAVAIAISAGVAVAIAAFGAALGQGRVGAAAMESIGRNPNAADKLFLPLVLTLALLEALALYGFVIAILLQGKI
jgi:F-type H+-transporting ATPase subunit c